MLIHIAHQEVAHSSFYRILRGPDPQTKQTGKSRVGAQRTPAKKGKRTLYATEKKEISSTNDLLGLLDDLFHDLLHHCVALVLAANRCIQGQLG